MMEMKKIPTRGTDLEDVFVKALTSTRLRKDLKQTWLTAWLLSSLE